MIKINNIIKNKIYKVILHSKTGSRADFHGFTLAEILIVIVILGVITSVALSPIITNTRQSQTVAKVLRTYADLQRAFDNYLVLEGPITGLVNISDVRDNSDRYISLYDNVIKPNIKIIKNCGTGGSGCMPKGDKVCKTLDGRFMERNAIYPCTSSTYIWNWEGAYYRVLTKYNVGIALQSVRSGDWDNVTSGGENYGIASDGSRIVSIIAIDTNGTRNPNTLGKDIFIFGFTKNGIQPYPMNSYNCNIKSTRSGINGAGCAEYIIKNKNMNYLKK